MKWIKMKTQHNIICEMPISFHNKNLDKDEKIKTKVCRQKQIIKIRIEIEEIEKK